jgi:hypothetical protein
VAVNARGTVEAIVVRRFTQRIRVRVAWEHDRATCPDARSAAIGAVIAADEAGNVELIDVRPECFDGTIRGLIVRDEHGGEMYREGEVEP